MHGWLLYDGLTLFFGGGNRDLLSHKTGSVYCSEKIVEIGPARSVQRFEGVFIAMNTPSNLCTLLAGPISTIFSEQYTEPVLCERRSRFPPPKNKVSPS